MSTPHQHRVQSYFDNLNVNQGLTDEALRDLGYDTPDTIADSLKRADPVPHVNSIGRAGEAVTGHTAQLELVDENHKPQVGAPSAAKLRKPPKATTARQKAAGDQAPVGQRRPQHGHDPYPPLRRVS